MEDETAKRAIKATRRQSHELQRVMWLWDACESDVRAGALVGLGFKYVYDVLH